MQIRKAISDWANKWFFVREKAPRVTIELGSAAIGVAVYIFVDINYGRAAGSFLAHGTFKLIGLVLGIAIYVILSFSICGIYNLCKWLIGAKAKKDGT
jgi:hypothetical protein